MSTRTDAEKLAIIEGFDPGGKLTVPEYCKSKDIAPSQYYTWRKELSKHPSKERIPKIVGARGSNLGAGNKVKKLEAQNEVLKEMLADAYKKVA